jgi:hypothetical protein
MTLEATPLVSTEQPEDSAEENDGEDRGFTSERWIWDSVQNNPHLLIRLTAFKKLVLGPV